MKKAITFLLAAFFCLQVQAQDVNDVVNPMDVNHLTPLNTSSFAFGDLLRNHNVDSLISVATGYGVCWTGSYYVVSNFSANMVYKIRDNWTLIQSMAITGGTGTFRNMVMAKGFLWGVNVTAAIHKVDTTTMTQVGQITLPGGTQARALAWDIGRQAFWVSTASFNGFMRAFDTLGVAIPNSDIPVANQPGAFYGAAYDNVTPGGPYLWIFSDGTPTSNPVKFTRWNIASLPPTRVDSIRVPIPLMTGSLGGGANFATNLVPLKATLVGLSQGTPDRVIVVETATLTGISQNHNGIPESYRLEQNYPNPFNPSTKINFDIPNASNVNIAVYDMLGRHIKNIINQNLSAGSYTAHFDAEGLPSGIYFYTITAGEFKETKKMMLVK